MFTVDYRNPVNVSHPLNRGRVAWWLVLPNTYGGENFYDLIGLNQGILTAMGNSSNGWRSNQMGGTAGSLLFDGSAGYISVNNSPSLSPNLGLTVLAWINPSSIGNSSAYPEIVCKSAAASWTSPYADYCLRINGLQSWVEASVNNPGNAANITGPSPRLSVGKLYRVGMTFDGSTLKLYINGSIEALASISTSINQSGRPLFIGARQGPGEFFSGYLNDVAIYSRALSAQEMSEDYELSKRGYPGVLNRIDPQKYFPLPSGKLFRRNIDMRTGSRSLSAA
jgi:Concanavalin A-like lectin/glucanases superfamily